MNKVNEIIKLQKSYYNDNKCFNFLGVLNIHCCKETNLTYLVDGQHRYSAIKNLHTMNYDGIVKVEIVTVNTVDELNDNYILINKNTELPEVIEHIKVSDKEKIRRIIELMNKTYGNNIWSSRKRTIRPYLNFTEFQEGMLYLVSRLKNYPVDSILKLIKNKNKELSLWSIDDYNMNIRRIKNWSKYKDIADINNFWLGMYGSKSENYKYEWVYEIYLNEYNKHVDKKDKKKIITKKERKKKKPIPRTIKNEVWKKYMGNVNEGLCVCCNLNMINSIKNCSYGHIKSEAEGGEVSIENLAPICNACNLGMQTENMIEYMKRNYPKSIKNNRYFRDILNEF